MNLTSLARTTSATVVAGVAAVASYTHMRDLAAAHGQPDVLAHLLPLSVDGMLIVSTIAMADDKAAGKTARLSARVSFTIGVVASIGANVLAAPPGLIARIISAWPAVALLLVVEMTSHTDVKPAPRDDTGHNSTEATAATAADKPTALVTTQKRQPRRQTTPDRVAKAVAKKPDSTPAQVAAKLGVSERTVQRHWHTAHCRRPGNDPHRRPVIAPLVAREFPMDGHISPR
ncbi:MAG: DUF2637 domain-containing protein [Micromonosporaceae bacterium]